MLNYKKGLVSSNKYEKSKTIIDINICNFFLYANERPNGLDEDKGE
jgi:hypothetical protein